MTVEQLKEWGANTEEGLSRCFGKADFYLRLVGMVGADKNYDALCAALEEKKLDQAFEAAHAMKGVLANLSLTPLLKPVSEMTELLRTRAEVDYGPLLSEIKAQREAFLALCRQ